MKKLFALCLILAMLVCLPALADQAMLCIHLQSGETQQLSTLSGGQVYWSTSDASVVNVSNSG